MADKPFDPYAHAGAGIAGVDAPSKPDYTVQKPKPALGSVAKSAFVPPKMEPNENTGAYAERVRKAREDYDAAQIEGQKKAVRGLK